MTSEFTLGPTAEFFKQHDFFCLDPDNVVLFEQRMLPVVTLDGKAILEQKHKVAMAPGRPRPPPPAQHRDPAWDGRECASWRPCGWRVASLSRS